MFVFSNPAHIYIYINFQVIKLLNKDRRQCLHTLQLNFQSPSFILCSFFIISLFLNGHLIYKNTSSNNTLNQQSHTAMITFKNTNKCLQQRKFFFFFLSLVVLFTFDTGLLDRRENKCPHEHIQIDRYTQSKLVWLDLILYFVSSFLCACLPDVNIYTCSDLGMQKNNVLFCVRLLSKSRLNVLLP